MAAFGAMGKTEWNLSVLWETRVILSLLLASFAQGVLQLLAVEGLYFFYKQDTAGTETNTTQSIVVFFVQVLSFLVGIYPCVGVPHIVCAFLAQTNA